MRGFTLIELLATMAILVIATAIAAPSFSAFMVDQRARGVASELVTAILTARSEAIKRNAGVTITAAVSGGVVNWGAGWVVTGPDPGGAIVQLDRKDVAGNRLASSTAPASIVFNSSGRTNAAGTVSIELRSAGGADGIAPRCVTVDLGGRPDLKRGACA